MNESQRKPGSEESESEPKSSLNSESPVARRLQSIIARHPLFVDLRRDHIAAMARSAMAVEFPAGELIFREGEPANRFFLIQKGRVALESKMEDSKVVLLEEIGPGDVLGWSWLVEPYVWQFSARTLEKTEAIFLYGTWLREQYERDGTLGYEMLRRMSSVMLRRLQAARRRILELLREDKCNLEKQNNKY